MSELVFVLKSFIIAAVLIVAMQVKVGNSSLESYSQWWLQKSSFSLYIQSVAAGGAFALKNLAHGVKVTLTGTVDSYREGSKAQTAVR